MNNGMRKCWDNKGNIYYEDISVIPKFGYQYSYTQNELIEYNNKKNWSYKDARDCMNIALIGPDNIQNTKEYRVISENRIIDLSKKTNFDIPKNLPVVEYSNDSSLAKSINNSDELKSQLKEWINNTNRQNDNLVQVEFTEPNLFRSLHNATLLNPKLENGYITGYIYDLYDFNYQNFDNFNTYKVNTGAVVLQNTNHLHNYRIIVPIKIKL